MTSSLLGEAATQEGRTLPTAGDLEGFRARRAERRREEAFRLERIKIDCSLPPAPSRGLPRRRRGEALPCEVHAGAHARRKELVSRVQEPHGPYVDRVRTEYGNEALSDRRSSAHANSGKSAMPSPATAAARAIAKLVKESRADTGTSFADRSPGTGQRVGPPSDTTMQSCSAISSIVNGAPRRATYAGLAQKRTRAAPRAVPESAASLVCPTRNATSKRSSTRSTESLCVGCNEAVGASYSPSLVSSSPSLHREGPHSLKERRLRKSSSTNARTSSRCCRTHSSW